jgi:hypothetical protein
VQSLERCQLAEAVLEAGKKLESPDAPLLLLTVLIVGVVAKSQAKLAAFKA